MMIASARADLGMDASVLPLGCDPPGWDGHFHPELWQVFDSTIRNSETTHPTEAAPGTRLVNPKLWKLRSLPQLTIDVADDQRARTIQDQQIRVKTLQEFSPQTAPMSSIRLNPTALAWKRTTPLIDSLYQGTFIALGATLPAGGTAHLAQYHIVSAVNPEVSTSLQTRHIDPELLRLKIAPAPSHIPLEVIDQSPSVDASTTLNSELHVHFEHSLVTITRALSGKRWWHAEFVRDDGWYIPGMRRGELIPDPPAPDMAYCLPRALLLIRNLEITGTWTAEARSALSSEVPSFGPFLLRPSSQESDASAVQTTTILGAGTQVIGVFATPLPALPPQDDPSSS
jgi:hypothetical protein